VLLLTDMMLVCKQSTKKASSSSGSGGSGGGLKIIRQPYVVDRIRVHELKEASSLGLVYLNEYGAASAALVLSAGEPKLAKVRMCVGGGSGRCDSWPSPGLASRECDFTSSCQFSRPCVARPNGKPARTINPFSSSRTSKGDRRLVLRGPRRFAHTIASAKYILRNFP
jgi:hypothetical protein